MREIRIVGDYNNPKPFMVVEYFRKKNNYIGYKILNRFKTQKEAVKLKEFVNCEKSEVGE